MTDQTNDQRELAEELVDMLQSDGVAHEISYIDLLDYLAILGFALKRDETGSASAAYQKAIGHAA